ncbi:orotidine 5'-phosphate decarboxylase / HUMPS family protein, partial [Burkholderia pseudomallei]
GSTAEQYAREAFERYRADAVTVHPYMGFDSIEPYLEYEDTGVVVLCRTSNPGGSDLQFLERGGRPLYQVVADLAASHWNAKSGQLALVVG